jgi:hypothetical protein
MKRTILACVVFAAILSGQDTLGQNIMDALGKMTDPSRQATYGSNYTFDTYVKMEVTTGGQMVIYESYVNKEKGNLAMVFTAEGMPMKVIFDNENESVIYLTNAGGQKAGMAMAINGDAIKEFAESQGKGDYEKPPEEYKTGRSKNILGYMCDEYLVKTGSSEARIWASEELGRELGKETLGNQKIMGGAFNQTMFGNGMVMEYDYTDGNETVILKIVELELNRSNSISTSGYQIMSLGQMF